MRHSLTNSIFSAFSYSRNRPCVINIQYNDYLLKLKYYKIIFETIVNRFMDSCNILLDKYVPVNRFMDSCNILLNFTSMSKNLIDTKSPPYME